jgi:hypothetical protein
VQIDLVLEGKGQKEASRPSRNLSRTRRTAPRSCPDELNWPVIVHPSSRDNGILASKVRQNFYCCIERLSEFCVHIGTTNPPQGHKLQTRVRPRTNKLGKNRCHCPVHDWLCRRSVSWALSKSKAALRRQVGPVSTVKLTSMGQGTELAI